VNQMKYNYLEPDFLRLVADIARHRWPNGELLWR
jgi:hypothetical protein